MLSRFAARASIVAALPVCLATGWAIGAPDPAPPAPASTDAAVIRPGAEAPAPPARRLAAPAFGAPRSAPDRSARLLVAEQVRVAGPVAFRPVRETAGPGLLARYRLALERESRRILDRDSALFWADSGDEDGNPARRAQREARRLFQGANGRVLSEIAEALIEEAAALRTARDYVDGVRLDVMRGGSVRFQAGRDQEEARGRDEEGARSAGEVAASFGVIALGRPRLEVRTNLPGGIRSRFEVPLASPGMRASFSRRLTARLRGTMSLGVEDAGADRWVTAGLAVRF